MKAAIHFTILAAVMSITSSANARDRVIYQSDLIHHWDGSSANPTIFLQSLDSSDFTAKLVDELYARATQYETEGGYVTVKTEVLTGFWTGRSARDRRLKISLLDSHDLLAVGPEGFGIAGQTARAIARALAPLSNPPGDSVTWPAHGPTKCECRPQDGRDFAYNYACWFSWPSTGFPSY